jgi:hypothetical protein
MTTTTIEPEVVSPVEEKLVKFARETGLQQASTTPLVEAFRPIFVESRKVLSDAVGVADSVKDATCVSEIRKARECRLAIRKVRIEGEKVRKAQKANALSYGKAVDGFYNILEADLSPVEKALQDAEDTAERAEVARKDAIEAGRKASMAPYVQDVSLYAVRDMAEPAFQALLIGVKTAKDQAEAAAKKAEEDRIAAEKARAADEARIKAENEKLRQEAIAQEAAAKAEREAAEKKLAEERAEAARVAAELKAKAEAEARAAKAKADMERAAVEAKAKAEREALEAKARAEKAAADAIAAKERAAREKLEAELAAQRAEEAKKKAREEEAARRAANAGDKDKLLAYHKAIIHARPDFKDREVSRRLGLAEVVFSTAIEKEIQRLEA